MTSQGRRRPSSDGGGVSGSIPRRSAGLSAADWRGRREGACPLSARLAAPPLSIRPCHRAAGPSRSRERHRSLVVDLVPIRDLIHGMRVVYFFPCEKKGIGAKLGVVESREGLTEHVLRERRD
jgi:hypothetical protein